jgi:SAM-dependent methyltransferase
MPPEFYDPDMYDARVEGVSGDIEFFTELAREAHQAGLPVLELACGTGRVSIPIAREGISVIGLDASSAMLARAREKAAGLENARWVEGDMRSFELPERFGLVFIPFRSFQHLLTVEDQLSCLDCIRRHLPPGGRLAIDVFNPNLVAIAEWLTTKRGGLQARGDDYVHPSGSTGKRWESRAYHLSRQEADITFLDEEVGRDGVVASRVYRGLKLRWLYRYEMEHLLARAGFEVEALYGDCYRAPFEDTSPEMVFVARARLGR